MNKKSLIYNICIAAASALMLIFMALPYMFDLSAYNVIGSVETCFNNGHLGSVTVWFAALFGLVISIILLAYAIYKILRVYKIIESNVADKIMNLIALICSIILVVVLVLAVIDLLIWAEFKYSNFLGWALVVNTILSFAQIVVILLDTKTN